MAFLKKHGIDEAQLRARFDMEREPVPENGGSKVSVGDAVKTLLGDTLQPTPPAPDPTSPELPASGSDGDGAGSGTGKGSGGARTKDAGARGRGRAGP